VRWRKTIFSIRTTRKSERQRQEVWTCSTFDAVAKRSHAGLFTSSHAHIRRFSCRRQRIGLPSDISEQTTEESEDDPVKVKKVNFEIYLADQKATTCI